MFKLLSTVIASIDFSCLWQLLFCSSNGDFYIYLIFSVLITWIIFVRNSCLLSPIIHFLVNFSIVMHHITTVFLVNNRPNICRWSHKIIMSLKNSYHLVIWSWLHHIAVHSLTCLWWYWCKQTCTTSHKKV